MITFNWDGTQRPQALGVWGRASLILVSAPSSRAVRVRLRRSGALTPRPGAPASALHAGVGGDDLLSLALGWPPVTFSGCGAGPIYPPGVSACGRGGPALVPVDDLRGHLLAVPARPCPPPPQPIADAVISVVTLEIEAGDFGTFAFQIGGAL